MLLLSRSPGGNTHRRALEVKQDYYHLRLGFEEGGLRHAGGSTSRRLLTCVYPPLSAGLMGPVRSVCTSSIGPSVWGLSFSACGFLRALAHRADVTARHSTDALNTFCPARLAKKLHVVEVRASQSPVPGVGGCWLRREPPQALIASRSRSPRRLLMVTRQTSYAPPPL